MTNYRNGSAMESRTKKKLEADGYYVMKSAGSKGVADLVAIKAGQVLLIQAKLSSYVKPSDWNELLTTADECGALAIVVGRGQRMHLIVGPKDGLGGKQPWIPWSPDDLA